MQAETAETGYILPMEINSEMELVRRCQKGDKQAYEGLVKKYMKRAYFIALGFLGSHENALDLSQEAFLRAFKAIQRLDPQKSFFTWYYCILKNLCFNFIRDQKHHARTFSQLDQHAIQNAAIDFADASSLMERNEIKEQVWKALDALKEQEKEIIVLKDFEGYSYKEISVLLEIPAGTVMSRLYNARKALKSRLERWFDEGS